MDYDYQHQHSPVSSRHRIKSSICVSSCFSHHIEPAASSFSGSDDDCSPSRRLVSRSSPSSWIRSRAHDLPDEIRGKLAGLFSKFGGRGSRRLTNTSEFRYDPMSYALNFDDEAARDDDFPIRNFMSRLPPSPSPPPNKSFPAAISRAVACT